MKTVWMCVGVYGLFFYCIYTIICVCMNLVCWLGICKLLGRARKNISFSINYGPIYDIYVAVPVLFFIYHFGFAIVPFLRILVFNVFYFGSICPYSGK